MRCLLVASIVPLIFLLAVTSVDAGYMTASKSVGTGGTTFSIQWFQGCGPNTRVLYLSGSTYSSSMNLMLGPNSCNTGASPGNNRAVHCLVGSDAGRTISADAAVNCNQCPCENPQNVNFLCRASTGLCEACDGCVASPCPHTWQDCMHLTCTTRSCTCNDDRCEAKSTPCVGGSMQVCSCSADKTQCNCVSQSCSSGGSSGDPNVCTASVDYTYDFSGNKVTRCRLYASGDVDDYPGYSYADGYRIDARVYNPGSGLNIWEGWIVVGSGDCRVSTWLKNIHDSVPVNYNGCIVEATGSPPSGSDPGDPGDPDPGDPDPGDPDPNPCSVFCPPPRDDLCAEGIVCPI